MEHNLFAFSARRELRMSVCTLAGWRIIKEIQ